MKKIVVLSFILLQTLLMGQALAADGGSLWQLIDSLEGDSRQALRPWVKPRRSQALRLDGEALQDLLARVPGAGSEEARQMPVILELPSPDGDLERFEIHESPVMAEGLASRMAKQGWPMKTYAGRSLDKPGNLVRLDWGGPTGFHAMVSGPLGSWLIDPAWRQNVEEYVGYYKQDSEQNERPLECNLVHRYAFSRSPLRAGQSPGSQLRTYRLAMAATGEYTAFHGSKINAEAAITTTVNRINLLYNRDLSLHLELVKDNGNIVFENPNTDPYTNDDPESMLDENQATLDNSAYIGSANYDIGHVLGTEGGGLASLGSSCGSWKAEGMTGLDTPQGDGFDIDYVAHELGHQLGGNHTYNAPETDTSGSCATREKSAAYEPGSGSTVMGYAGICDQEDLQQHADDYFHGRSLDEMLDHLGGNGACHTKIASGNANAPQVSVPASGYTIPANTPFELTASASDADSGDVPTYTWEQFDLGPAMSVRAVDNGASPILRGWPPTTNPVRIIPRLENLLAGTLPIGEQLPSTSRTMNFRVTVRDNHAGGGRIGEASMTVTSSSSSGFKVIAPNGGETLSASGSATLTWDVASTDASPISTSSVDILLSTDGGNSFPYTLATATPNDGSHGIILPNVAATTQARIKIKGGGNIFFDISDANFSVTNSGGGDTYHDLNVSITGTGTVTSNPSGISCPGSCSQSYIAGTPVTLTADPGVDYQFSGWGGSCSGTATCSVTLNQTTSVTATFAASGSSSDSVEACSTASIPLVDGGSVTDQLIASGAGTISDLDLFLDVTHGYVGDLIVTLENAIAGKSVEVINEPGYPASEYGCTGADINATLDDEGSSPVEDACNTSGTAISGTFTPDNPLSAFDGLAFDGTWKLTVADPYTEYSGNLVKWCLRATVSSSSTTNDNCSTGKLPLTSGFSSGSTERYSETEIVTSGTVAITGTGTLVTLEAPKIVLSGGFSVENGAGLVAKAKAVDCSAL